MSDELEQVPDPLRERISRPSATILRVSARLDVVTVLRRSSIMDIVTAAMQCLTTDLLYPYSPAIVLVQNIRDWGLINALNS